MKNGMKMVLGAGALAMVAGGVQADEFMNAAPMFKVVDDGLVTEERLVISPLVLEIDTDVNGTPDKLAVRFKVYQAGSNTVQLATQQRATFYPDVPCSDPNWEYSYFDFRFGGDTSANRVHMFIELITECEENLSGEYKEAIKTFVYSANVTSSGSSWVQQFNGWQLEATAREDYSGDGDYEAMMWLVRDNANGTATGRVIFMEMGDGTIVADNLSTVVVFK